MTDSLLTAILLGCVKSKVDHRAPARDLYCSRLWQQRRAYAEASDLPWLILSAKHGLVEPDQVLTPYDLALRELPAAERRRWGEHVAADLSDRFGALTRATFEVHAGAPYRDAIAAPLARLGARITAPLAHIPLGEQPRWYAQRRPPIRTR